MKKNQTITAKAAANVPTSYGTWTADVKCGGAEYVRLFFTYTHSDATSLEFSLQFSTDGGTTWFDDHKLTAGASELNEITFVSATAKFTHSVDVSDISDLRVKAKNTGGGATGNTLALDYIAGVS